MAENDYVHVCEGNAESLLVVLQRTVNKLLDDYTGLVYLN